MTWTGCEETVWWLTRALKDRDVCARLRQLRRDGGQAADYVDALVSVLNPEAAAIARMELSELPSLTTATLIEAWAMADASGKPFQMVSERPQRPLEYARRHRVSLSLHADDDGVSVSLAHVARRHAGWYAPR